MGTWGYKNFENDTAQDFLGDLTDTGSIKMFRKVFNEAMGEATCLEAPICLEALAAAELMCMITEGDIEALPSSVIEWYNKGTGIFRKKISFKNNELKKAAYTVEKIMMNSELKDLWEESDEYSKWQENNEQLVNRLLSQI